MAATAPLHRSVAVVVGLVVVPCPVAAHGSETAGSGSVPLPVALAVVTLLGISAGMVTAVGRDRPIASRLIGRAVGPLLLGIGGWAIVSVAISRPIFGLIGTIFGLLVGIALAAHGRCGDVAIGAIIVHRFVEGVALAALSVAGSVGLLGLVLFSGHTVAECVAITGQPERSRLNAVGTVLVISAAFISGAGFGAIGLVAVPAAPRIAALSVVGGLLLVVGLAESRFECASRYITIHCIQLLSELLPSR